ncbi:hypothetical protein G9464_07940 [Halostella sp. JP-L12]|uniref:helix-turn-helix transcriptional regulator n=1 Tax=Halostella TaxID=1843185 RepID=UPI000EF84C0A|nr:MULTISPECIES: helix-turn-helix domain-containing protein [Halostella]NHN47525.1 hypothetical protein [Halostella sp. JP-L12]
MVARRAAALAVLLCLAALVPSVAASAAGADDQGASPSATVAPDPVDDAPPSVSDSRQPSVAVGGSPDTDTTVTRIAVHANGSATWTLEVRTRLTTDADVEDYEAFRERVRENRSRYLDPFRDRMEGVVANAGEATGREMAAGDFAVSTRIQEVPRRWGVVTYSFRWDGFAATDGDAVVAGDVFQGGYYLADNDTLAIEAPADHAVADADPTPDEREGGDLTWIGPESFDDERPRVAFEPADDETTEGGSAAGDGETGAGGDADPDGSPSQFPTLVVGAVVAVGLVGALGYRAYAGGPGEGEGEVAEGADPSSGDAGEDGDAERGTETAASATAEGAAAGSATDERGPNADAVADPELLTDEDRVVRLLEREGGRCKQSAIADELGWSASKTSRVVSDMAEAGTVEKLRIGRENVIDLDGGPSR